MIKANELRIGNIVESTLFGTRAIVTLNDVSLPLLITHGGNEFYPIPLTPEILDKCGFETIKYDNCSNDTIYWALKGLTSDDLYVEHLGIQQREVDFDVEQTDDEYLIDFCGIHIEIKSLHQLQNLYFALTGKELEVTAKELLPLR